MTTSLVSVVGFEPTTDTAYGAAALPLSYTEGNWNGC
jgi:hypothetical protein